MDKVFEQRTFDNIDPSGIIRAGYEECIFTCCSLSAMDLSGYQFSDCTFSDCDLSNVKLNKTSFKNARFINCKMLGLHFEYCDPFLLELSFEKCLLSFSCFYKLRLKNTAFSECLCQECDFSDADLSGVRFHKCDLHLSVFNNTMLEKADFRTAINYSIHPVMNKIRKAKFSREGISGLLDGFDITIE